MVLATDAIRGNIAIGSKSVIAEVERVYYLLKEEYGFGLSDKYSKFLVIEIYRQLLTDRGMMADIHRLTLPAILAWLKRYNSDFNGRLPEKLEDYQFNLIAEHYKNRGFAFTPTDAKRVYQIMVKRQKLYGPYLLDDPQCHIGGQRLQDPLKRVGTPDKKPNSSASSQFSPRDTYFTARQRL